jgi:hypothetical protein
MKSVPRDRFCPVPSSGCVFVVGCVSRTSWLITAQPGLHVYSAAFNYRVDLALARNSLYLSSVQLGSDQLSAYVRAFRCLSQILHCPSLVCVFSHCSPDYSWLASSSHCKQHVVLCHGVPWQRVCVPHSIHLVRPMASEIGPGIAVAMPR